MKRRHTTPKTQLQGYALHVKLQGEQKYSRQGFLFASRTEAEQYRFRHFPQAVAWRIEGIRVDPRPGIEYYPANNTPPKGSAA